MARLAQSGFGVGILDQNEKAGQECVEKLRQDKYTAMCWQLAYNPYNTNSIFAAFGDVARGHTAVPPGEGAIYVTYDRGDTWEEVGLQKRGTKYLRPPAIRVLWAAADG